MDICSSLLHVEREEGGVFKLVSCLSGETVTVGRRKRGENVNMINFEIRFLFFFLRSRAQRHVHSLEQTPSCVVSRKYVISRNVGQSPAGLNDSLPACLVYTVCSMHFFLVKTRAEDSSEYHSMMEQFAACSCGLLVLLACFAC